MNVAAQLVRLRRAAALTQRDAALKSGVHHRTLEAYEQERLSAFERVLGKIARIVAVYGVEIGDFVTMCTKANALAPEERRLVASLTRNSQLANEADVSSPTVFRATIGSTITFRGADGVYDKRKAVKFACSRPRCGWLGTEDELSRHHESHLARAARAETITDEKRFRKELARIHGGENA